MITVNVLEVVLYGQLSLSLVLFFCLQLLAIAGYKAEKLVDWLAYRSTWWAVGFQALCLLVTGAIVFHAPTDPTIVGHTVLLILLNATWFITLRITFEFVDYLEARRNV